MAAAAETPQIMLWKAISCPLCSEYFTHPVMLFCGHNFCQGCIVKCWADPNMHSPICPQCQVVSQQWSMKANPQLAKIVGIAQQLHAQVEDAVTWGVCEHHQEPLNLFCKHDGACICVLCRQSWKCKDHPVIPAEEAAEEYKAQIGTYLENLRRKKEEVLASKENREYQDQDLMDEIEEQRQIAVDAFRGLREFLKELENRLLAQMEEVGKPIAKKSNEDIARLSEELSSLKKIIWEMEEECEKPPRGLLKNIKGMLQRYEQRERFETPAPFPPPAKWRVWDFWEINPILETATKTFKDTLTSVSPQHKENVTLDPETAHPQLLISEDRKCVTVSDQQQTRPEGIWTSAHYRTVLGSVGFKSGRHCWEVDVGNEEGWAVGIAVANVQYNKDIPLGPDAGVWAIGDWGGRYRAVIHPRNTPLLHQKKLKKIRVSLNNTGCQVTFFDAETAALLYAFSIPGQPSSSAYYPFLGVTMNAKLRLGW